MTYDITPVTRKSFEIDNFKRFFVGYIPKLYALSDTLNVSFYPVIGGREQYEHFMRFHKICGETPSEFEGYKEASKEEELLHHLRRGIEFKKLDPQND